MTSVRLPQATLVCFVYIQIIILEFKLEQNTIHIEIFVTVHYFKNVTTYIIDVRQLALKK